MSTPIVAMEAGLPAYIAWARASMQLAAAAAGNAKGAAR